MTQAKTLRDIDAHAPPPPRLRVLYKRISKADPALLQAHAHAEFDDVQCPAQVAATGGRFVRAGTIPRARIDAAFAHLGVVGPRGSGGYGKGEGDGGGGDGGGDGDGYDHGDAPIFAHKLMPGLLIAPALLPPEIQTLMLDRMLHRDLATPTHLTNLHPHYKLPYPPPPPPQDASSSSTSSASFFDYPPDCETPLFEPLDPSLHKPLTVRRALEKALHWVTLGGQYDWTARVYPPAEEDGQGSDETGQGPPAFPADLTGLLKGLFPETDAQAAIVNVYATSNTMMMHRDVSEEADRGLISLSFGCDGLFMTCPDDVGDDASWGVDPQSKIGDVGKQEQDEKKYILLRLRSGDVIYMTKEARCAWHGVPKVLAGTCPDYLADWPAKKRDTVAQGDGDGNGNRNGVQDTDTDHDRFAAWRGWMSQRRINFNVRQMKE